MGGLLGGPKGYVAPPPPLKLLGEGPGPPSYAYVEYESKPIKISPLKHVGGLLGGPKGYVAPPPPLKLLGEGPGPPSYAYVEYESKPIKNFRCHVPAGYLLYFILGCCV